MKSLEVKCPHCKTKFTYYSSDYRPFCSDKCRMVDLGLWVSEAYSVPAQKMTPEEAETIERIIDEKYQDEN